MRGIFLGYARAMVMTSLKLRFTNHRNHMQLQATQSSVEGTVVTYQDSFSVNYVPVFSIRVTRSSILVLGAKISNQGELNKFSEAMKKAVDQFQHLQNHPFHKDNLCTTR